MNSPTVADGIQTANLVVGSPAESDLYDDHGALMLRQGTLITGLLVSKLLRHGVEFVFFSPPDVDKATEAATSDDSSGEIPSGRGEQESGTEMTDVQANAVMNVYSAEKRVRLNQLFDFSVQVVESMVRKTMETGNVDLKHIDPVIEKVVTEITDDSDPVMARTLIRLPDLQLTHRCVQFSTLAVGVGIRMKLTHKDVADLGRAAMSHDWALFELPDDQRFPHQQRQNEASLAYKQHPIASELLVAADPGHSTALKTIVGQVHERMDGSGFPRKLIHEEIHPLSRILAVVDTYLSLTNAPPGFPRIVPSDAMAYLVRGMSSGKFAPLAVSGLLETISLYPLGSLFELSDASRVRAVHTNGPDYGYPIVEDIDDRSRRIDLKQSELFVTRPITIDEFGEVRLPDSSG